jgi:hypothetical protein
VHQTTKRDGDRAPSLFSSAVALVVEAMPEGVGMLATVPYRTQAHIYDPGHDSRQEDKPEISGRCIGVPEVGRRAEVEKCG